jgi:hypothetical protein
MDQQIRPLVDKHQFLADDPAVQALVNSADPFRCLYYDAKSTVNIYGEINTCVRKNINDMNSCPGQKDANDLYMSYNFYCDLATSTETASGIPVQKCNFAPPSVEKLNSDGTLLSSAKSSGFATKDSWGFYREANKRVDSGELKIINFETTNLYKNKIANLGLENFEKYSITREDSKDLLNDLGIAGSDAEIFSINVAPPIGAGALDPSGMFKRASDLCFSNSPLMPADAAMFGQRSKDIQASINELGKCVADEPRASLERYYLSGMRKAVCDEGYTYQQASKMCMNDEDPTELADPLEDGDLVPTEFMSADKSCRQYETALVTSRNAEYGKFDTALKNYIEDQIASLVKKKTKDLAKVQKAFMSLQDLDIEMTSNLAAMRARAKKAKNDAEIAILQADIDLSNQMLAVDRQEIEARRERARMYSDSYATKIIATCLPKVEAVVLAQCGEGWKNCGAGDPKNFVSAPGLGMAWASAISNQSLYINKLGDIQPTTRFGCDEDSGNIFGSCNKPRSIKLPPPEATPQGGEYFELWCADMPQFADHIMKPFRFDIGQLYNAIFTMACTGDNPFKDIDFDGGKGQADGWVQGMAQSSAQGGALGGFVSVVLGSGGALGGVGNILGGTDRSVATKVTYGKPYVKGGKCYVEKTTTSTGSASRSGMGGLVGGVSDLFVGRKTVNESKTETIAVPGLLDEYIEKGLDIFDEKILPALDFSAGI